MAGGFGASKGGSDRAVTEAPGSTEAKIALESSGGDLNKATSMVFQRRLQKLQEEDEELGAMLTELSTGMARPAGPIENEAVHEALVSATWDAVAVMNALPKSRKTSAEEKEEKRIAKRLRAIADAARLPPGEEAGGGRAPDGGEGSFVVAVVVVEGEAGLASPNGKVLDIGCGDGSLMPYLLDEDKKKKKQPKVRKGGKKRKAEEGSAQQAETQGPLTATTTTTATAPPPAIVAVQEADVTGVDLSEVMISAAKQKYPKARWITGNALALDALLGREHPEPLFSSIIFNGSLQFFLDPPSALARASEWLVDGGHVVIAHVQGSDFVREECRKNRRVAPSPMPGREGMKDWASKAGCSLLEGPDDFSQRSFLLQVMRKL